MVHCNSTRNTRKHATRVTAPDTLQDDRLYDVATSNLHERLGNQRIDIVQEYNIIVIAVAWQAAAVSRRKVDPYF